MHTQFICYKETNPITNQWKCVLTVKTTLWQLGKKYAVFHGTSQLVMDDVRNTQTPCIK